MGARPNPGYCPGADIYRHLHNTRTHSSWPRDNQVIFIVKLQGYNSVGLRRFVRYGRANEEGGLAFRHLSGKWAGYERGSLHTR